MGFVVSIHSISSAAFVVGEAIPSFGGSWGLNWICAVVDWVFTRLQAKISCQLCHWFMGGGIRDVATGQVSLCESNIV